VRLHLADPLGRHRPRELADERVLRVIRVLVLVDEDVPEAPLVERGDLREGTEEVDRLGDEVVEVERAGIAEATRVLAEDLEEHDLLRVVRVRIARV
jgi:hypothetical protein